MKWLVNGRPADGIRPDDRGFSYGDGLFETIAVRGGECRLFAEHMARLASGAARLGLPPPDSDTLMRDAQSLLGPEPLDGTLKIVYSRGPGQRGYALPPVPQVTVAVGFGAGRRAPLSTAGIAARTCRTPVGRNPVLAGMKTLNRLEQVLARAEWQDEDVAEGLMFDTDGQLVCGTMSNVFLVREQQLLTPLLDHCGVLGIMRAQVMAAAGRLGIPLAETRLTLTSLQQAEEVFVTNSQIGIWPVTSLDGRPYVGKRLTARLRAELARAGIAE